MRPTYLSIDALVALNMALAVVNKAQPEIDTLIALAIAQHTGTHWPAARPATRVTVAKEWADGLENTGLPKEY